MQPDIMGCNGISLWEIHQRTGLAPSGLIKLSFVTRVDARYIYSQSDVNGCLSGSPYGVIKYDREIPELAMKIYSCESPCFFPDFPAKHVC